MNNDKVLAVDFDGVIAQYDGWKGEGILGDLIIDESGLSAQSLNYLKEQGWKIIIFSTRSAEEIQAYLDEHKIPYDEINKNSDVEGTNPGKPVYTILLDDRAITFDGSWAKALGKINQFKPFWE